LKIEVKKKIDDFFDGRYSDQPAHHHHQTLWSAVSIHAAGTDARKPLCHAGEMHVRRFFINTVKE